MADSNRNKRHALLALGMALFAIVLSSWLGNQSSHKHGPLKNAPQYEGEARNITSIVTSDDDFHPWRDTVPQWSIAFLSLAATGCSIWAVFIVRDTLQANREAVQAAQDAVIETRRIGEAQTRAYLACSEAEHFTSEQTCFIRIKISNSGQSPAISAKIASYVATPNFEQQFRDGDFHFSIPKTAEIFNVVSSGVEIASLALPMKFGTKVCTSIVDGERPFAVRCELTWVDVFGKSQNTTFYLAEISGETHTPERGTRHRTGVMSPRHTSPLHSKA